MIPEFAIMGHPNEGKSSVLSTLAEDDSVRISDTPGETRECRVFPVVIDGQEILRFTDTPGFQNPGRVLSELRKLVAAEERDPLATFRKNSANIAELHDDNELLAPVEKGAGIIYVVDGSRPLRHVDRTEMEIFRLIGKPRMAIINSKEDSGKYVNEWKMEFRKSFNSSRVFNAHRATYAERISLLEALKSIDQDWQDILGHVVDSFKQDWATRNEYAADVIVRLLRGSLRLQIKKDIVDEERVEKDRQKLVETYSKRLSEMEKIALSDIRGLYKHNIFHYQMPEQSLLNSSILDQRSWELLGMTRKQVVLTGALGGAAVGLGLDAATLGHSFGAFATLGGVIGGFGAIWSGEKLTSQKTFLGVALPFSFGGEILRVGPAHDINLLFVLLNRTLLYYQHTINWAHGRRDYTQESHDANKRQESEGNSAFTQAWTTANLKVCNDYFRAVQKDDDEKMRKAEVAMKELIIAEMEAISEQ